MSIGLRPHPRLSLGGWTPLRLGSSLLGWWDAERSDLITQSGGTVSSWRDVVAGYDAVQATGSAKPVYSATSFNSRPGLTFDGVDDNLLLQTTAIFPTGANGSEIWALCDQQAAAGDATNRGVAAYGTGSTDTARRLQRNVVGGVNRAGIRVGTGGGFNSTINSATVDVSGRHVIRGIVGGTQSAADVDGVAGTPAAAVPATAMSRFALGAYETAAGSFWQGQISAVLVTAPLSADQAAQILAYLKARGGIS